MLAWEGGGAVRGRPAAATSAPLICMLPEWPPFPPKFHPEVLMCSRWGGLQGLGGRDKEKSSSQCQSIPALCHCAEFERMKAAACTAGRREKHWPLVLLRVKSSRWLRTHQLEDKLCRLQLNSCCQNLFQPNSRGYKHGYTTIRCSNRTALITMATDL